MTETFTKLVGKISLRLCQSSLVLWLPFSAGGMSGVSI